MMGLPLECGLQGADLTVDAQPAEMQARVPPAPPSPSQPFRTLPSPSEPVLTRPNPNPPSRALHTRTRPRQAVHSDAGAARHRRARSCGTLALHARYHARRSPPPCALHVQAYYAGGTLREPFATGPRGHEHPPDGEGGEGGGEGGREGGEREGGVRGREDARRGKGKHLTKGKGKHRKKGGKHWVSRKGKGKAGEGEGGAPAARARPARGAAGNQALGEQIKEVGGGAPCTFAAARPPPCQPLPLGRVCAGACRRRTPSRLPNTHTDCRLHGLLVARTVRLSAVEPVNRSPRPRLELVLVTLSLSLPLPFCRCRRTFSPCRCARRTLTARRAGRAGRRSVVLRPLPRCPALGEAPVPGWWLVVGGWWLTVHLSVPVHLT
jgi:hypothetical protein